MSLPCMHYTHYTPKRGFCNGFCNGIWHDAHYTLTSDFYLSIQKKRSMMFGFSEEEEEEEEELVLGTLSENKNTERKSACNGVRIAAPATLTKRLTFRRVRL